MKTISSLSELDVLVEKAHKQGETLYIRWSRGPEFDKCASMNYVTGRMEAGLSAIALNGDSQDKREWYEAFPVRWIAMQVRSYRFLRMKDEGLRPWVLTGTLAGIGGDGEPCISDPQFIAVLDESVVGEARSIEPIF